MDDEYAMAPDALADAIAEDFDRGSGALLLLRHRGHDLLAGRRSGGRRWPWSPDRGVWLHVDGAMAGSAAVCPELRWVNDGLDRADSYAFNPHKWLFTNFDCTCFWVADRGALLAALSILPEYLRNEASASGAVIDYRDWQVPLGRRFRALKLWFVIRHYGAEGLAHHVRRHVALAREPSWAGSRLTIGSCLAAPPRLGLVCLRHVDGDDATQALMDAVNASGEQYLTHTRLDGRLVIRISIGQTHTEERHVRALWNHLLPWPAPYREARMTVTVTFEGATHADIVARSRTWLAHRRGAGPPLGAEAIEQGAGLYKDALRIIAAAAPRPVAENEIVKSLTDMGYRATDVTKDRLSTAWPGSRSCPGGTLVKDVRDTGQKAVFQMNATLAKQILRQLTGG